MTHDIRKIIDLLESAYVPGTESDPNVQWKKQGANLIRKPGRSIHWKVIQQEQDWVIQRQTAEGPGELMSYPEWKAGSLRQSAGFGQAGQDGILRFPEQDDAEIALQAYERGMAKSGYHGGS